MNSDGIASAGEAAYWKHTMSEHVIAVIDDEPVFLDFLQELLLDEGYHPVTWPRMNGALAMLRAARPSLILLDGWIGTPGSGLTLLDDIKQDSMLRHIPVVVCSGDQHIGDMLEATDAGTIHAIIKKPFDLAEFLAVIQSALGVSPDNTV